MNKTVLACDFCARTHHEVAFLIAGVKVAICDGCVSEAAEIITNERDKIKNGQVGNAPA